MFTPSRLSDDDLDYPELSQSLTRADLPQSDPLPQFYRGNIEGGATRDDVRVTPYNNDDATWAYYGAAKNLNEKLVLKESSETVPGDTDDTRARSALPFDDTHHLRQQHKQFSQSRPHGHSLTYDKLQGDHFSLCKLTGGKSAYMSSSPVVIN